MTFEELKEEAKRQGYRLVKEEKKEPLLPCTCGCKRRSSLLRKDWRPEGSIWMEVLRCQRCDRSAEGETKKAARENWNKMIRAAMEEEELC